MMSGIVRFLGIGTWFIACLDRYLPRLPYIRTVNFTIYGMANLNYSPQIKKLYTLVLNKHQNKNISKKISFHS